MKIEKLSREELFDIVKKNILPAKIVLDIGCGIRPQNYIEPKVHICCDPHQEYIEHLRDTLSFYRSEEGNEFTPNEFCTLTKKNNSGFVFINTEWENIVKLIPAKSVNSVFLLDVIEHLEKKAGLELIEKTAELCRNQVIIFSPLGFVEQEHESDTDAWGFNGAKLQRHYSGWLPEDFDDSWDIFVCENFHTHDNLGNEYTEPKGAFFAIKTKSKQFFTHEADFDKAELSDLISELGEFVLSEKNDLERAENLFKKAAQLSPFNANAINNLGITSWNKNQFDKAVNYFSQCFSMNNSNEIYASNLAEVLKCTGGENEAKEVMTKYFSAANGSALVGAFENNYGATNGNNSQEKKNNLAFWQEMQNDNYFENHMYYGQGKKELPLYGDDLELIGRFVELKNEMTVAVIGCGYGRESVLIGPHVKRIYGIDVNQKILNKAEKYVREKGVCNFIPVLAHSWESAITHGLDFVFEIAVFQHLTKDLTKEYIGGMRKKIKAGGKILCQFFESEYGTHDADLRKYEPCVNWSMPEIVELAKECDLEILKVEHRHFPEDKADWHWVLFGSNRDFI
jgi:2-polyprenyl-3-methyl-5-hydroxy-6-metoxy-1,4-benzoquinol methylase